MKLRQTRFRLGLSVGVLALAGIVSGCGTSGAVASHSPSAAAKAQSSSHRAPISAVVGKNGSVHLTIQTQYWKKSVNSTEIQKLQKEVATLNQLLSQLKP